MNFALIMTLIGTLLGGGMTAASVADFERSAVATDIKAFLTEHQGNISDVEIEVEKKVDGNNSTATSTREVNLEVKLEADNGAKLEREFRLESVSALPLGTALGDIDRSVKVEVEFEDEDGIHQERNRNRGGNDELELNDDRDEDRDGDSGRR